MIVCEVMDYKHAFTEESHAYMTVSCMLHICTANVFLVYGHVHVFHTLINLHMHVEKTGVYMATALRVSTLVPFINREVEEAGLGVQLC